MKLIEQICKLWWVEAGRDLTNPYSSESLQALELVLREDFDYDDNVVEYVMESIMRTPTHFKIGGDTDSGIDVDDDENITLTEKNFKNFTDGYVYVDIVTGNIYEKQGPKLIKRN